MAVGLTGSLTLAEELQPFPRTIPILCWSRTAVPKSLFAQGLSGGLGGD